MALNTVGAASQWSSDERMMVYFQANDGKMIVNDGEMLVNDGELSVWSYTPFTIFDWGRGRRSSGLGGNPQSWGVILRVGGLFALRFTEYSTGN